MRTFYDVLSILRNASTEEVKRAYRRVARECHPDYFPDDELAKTRFHKAWEAYSVLSDSDQRQQYDKLIAPPESLTDLFINDPVGQKVVEIMIEHAPVASVDGVDTTAVLEVRESEDSILVPPTYESEVEVLLDLLTAPEAREDALGSRTKVIWLHRPSFGEVGQNNGKRGDQWVAFRRIIQ
ncbi:MAG: J domain-containing protein [Candidatus Magasanikbacteria bacterium]